MPDGPFWPGCQWPDQWTCVTGPILAIIAGAASGSSSVCPNSVCPFAEPQLRRRQRRPSGHWTPRVVSATTRPSSISIRRGIRAAISRSCVITTIWPARLRRHGTPHHPRRRPLLARACGRREHRRVGTGRPHLPDRVKLHPRRGATHARRRRTRRLARLTGGVSGQRPSQQRRTW